MSVELVWKAYSLCVTPRICIVSCKQMSWWVFSTRYWLAFKHLPTHTHTHTRWCVLSYSQVSFTEESWGKKTVFPQAMGRTYRSKAVDVKPNPTIAIRLLYGILGTILYLKHEERVCLFSTFGRLTPNEKLFTVSVRRFL